MPVDWVDDPDSRVDIVTTARDDLRGVARLGQGSAARRPAAARSAPADRARRTRSGRRAEEPCLAGVPLRDRRRAEHAGLSAAVPARTTVASGAQAANLTALLITAVANTAANRRFTFGAGRPARYATRPRGWSCSRSGSALTSGALALLAAAVATSRACRGGDRPRRRQPRRHRAALRPHAGVGLRPPCPRRQRRYPGSDPMTTTVTSDYALYEPPVAAPEPPARAERRAATGSRCSDCLRSTAVLYLWSLGASGYANEFYAAAVQAGTKSWKAFFFGSFDSANFDHRRQAAGCRCGRWSCPGASSASTRGRCSCPQAIMGVLTGLVAVRDRAPLVRRRRRPARRGAARDHAGRRADVPVQQPRRGDDAADRRGRLLRDARARERVAPSGCCSPAPRWDSSFLAKGLQPFTVLPALALAYLVAAPTSLGRRFLQLLGAGVALVVAAGWWVLAVDLTPAADRPVHRRLGQQHRARPRVRLQRPVAHHRRVRRSGGGGGAQLQRHQPASAGCSTRSTAARSRGCCRRRCSRSSRSSP